MWLEHKQNCECYFNQFNSKGESISSACGGNCYCLNQKCISNDNNKRIKNTVNTYVFNFSITCFLICLLILLPILYFLITKIYKYNVSKKANILVLSFIIVIILIIILCINIIPKKEVVISKNCSPLPSPP